MKNKFILGFVAISMLTFASCSKEAMPNDDPNGVPDGTPTTATITLKSAPSTMATEAGSAEESKLVEATLYVFNNADVLESIQTVADMAAKQNKITFQTTTGAKRLFVCGNMNAALPTFETVTSNPAAPTKLVDFKKTVMNIPNLATISTNNKFWMMNLEKQPALVNVVVGTNQFTVNIGRATAKVRLAIGNGVTAIGGTLTDVKFKTKQNPKGMYLMPVYDGTNYTGNQLLTPYYATAVTPGNYIDGVQTNVPGGTYMVENSNEEIKAGKATYLEVEGVFTPAMTKTKNANGTAATTQLAKGAAYWRIAQYDKAPDAAGAKVTGYTEWYYNAAPAAGQLGSNQKAVEYQGGKSYYAIYVQDKTAGTEDQLPLRYTIKRNTFFKVVINSISGAGTNTPGDVIPDPNDPIETQVELGVTVTVADWTIADLSAGI